MDTYFRLGRAFRRIEKWLGRFAHRRVACCLLMGALVLGLRLAMLPLVEPPLPYIYDEFGYLLQADTFAAGRLTNPAHPLAQFFEAPYILVEPTYTAKYPPGQGLIMALGKVVTGDPWYGVWLSCGILMATLCWALQGWLTPGWALFGAALSLQLCLFSYWMDGYWGGALAATGGALMLGAYPRIVFEKRRIYALLLGLGAVILALTRMYEGLLFVIPLLVFLIRRDRSPRVWAFSGAVVFAGALFLLYYNYRVTGHALELPYLLHQKQYGYAPYFSFQGLRDNTANRHENLFNHSHIWEFERWKISRTPQIFIFRFNAWWKTLRTMGGGTITALVFVLFLAAAWRRRSSALPFLCLGIVFAGSFVETVYYEHYAAPATAALLLIAVYCFQQLRATTLPGRISGRLLARLLAVLFFTGMLLYEGSRFYKNVPVLQTLPPNASKTVIERSLRATKGGRHVILVRYSSSRTPHEEWIYNRADIDAADVIWAHDMGPAENQKILAYFRGRSFWRFNADDSVKLLVPYEANPALPGVAQ